MGLLWDHAVVRKRFVLVGVCVALLTLAGSRGAEGAGPSVFWASDPVRPGEAVVLVGDSLGTQASVEVARLTDGPSGEPGPAPSWPGAARPVTLAQASEQSLKFVLPAECEPGVFAYRITTPGGSAMGLLNRPRLWWAQGDRGITASPGGWVRLFGLNLALEGSKKPATATVRLQGPKTVALAAQADAYSAKVALPADLPPGDYQVHFHNGFGGPAAWSGALALRVAKPTAWPEASFNVKDFGAEGNGVKDDTEAVLAALDKAAQNGGGVIFFPRGRYRLSDSLTIPRFTVLRGEREDLVALCWTDFPKPPEVLLRGTNSFGLEELTLYTANYKHVLVGDGGEQPEAGDVFLRRVRVRANSYRGHLKLEEVDARFHAAASWGGGATSDTVRLGGKNIEITNCDLYGTGRVLVLSRVRGGRIVGNRLYNGRWGWYCISGSNGLIIEDNDLIGADPMATGGGLNLGGSLSSENVWMARNRFSLMHGWDREAMTSDNAADIYFGKVVAKGTTLTLAASPKTGDRDVRGAGVYILDGRGAGQYRRVTANQGTTFQIDRPFEVDPDASSEVAIGPYQGRYMLVANEFTDTGAMQFYGTSIECLVAGNRGTRMQGFRGLGLWYYGYQPSWFCQFVDNEIAEGNYYHFDSATDAMLEIYGAKHPPYEGPLNRASVVRRNRLASNAHIRVHGSTRDAIVEGNQVEKAEMGIFVSSQAKDILVRNNQFSEVRQEVVDEEAARRAAEERLKRYLGRQEPVAVWSFEELVRDRFADSSGNHFSARIHGGVTQVPGGIKGQAARFDGTGYLAVEEPAVFNAPDVTVSLWIKPEVLSGRRGLIGKRLAGTGAPFILSHSGASIAFEACEESGQWTFNFSSPAALQQGQWTHVAAVAKQGSGVTLYVDGKVVAVKENAVPRAVNLEPLILGREAWGGDPPKGDTPGFYAGLIDEVKVWTRALSPDEILAEIQSAKQ